jgi:hypothetical protein
VIPASAGAVSAATPSSDSHDAHLTRVSADALVDAIDALHGPRLRLISASLA